MTSADWEDECKGIVISSGIEQIFVSPSEAEDLIDRMRQLLDEHPEE